MDVFPIRAKFAYVPRCRSRKKERFTLEPRNIYVAVACSVDCHYRLRIFIIFVKAMKFRKKLQKEIFDILV